MVTFTELDSVRCSAQRVGGRPARAVSWPTTDPGGPSPRSTSPNSFLSLRGAHSNAFELVPDVNVDDLEARFGPQSCCRTKTTEGCRLGAVPEIRSLGRTPLAAPVAWWFLLDADA